MKKIAIIILSLLFITSSFIYINLSTIENVVNDIPKLLDSFDTQEEWQELISFTPVYEMVPVEYHDKMEAVLEKISNDKNIESIITEQSNNALSDVINGTNSFDQEMIISDLMDVFDDYAGDISNASDNQIPQEMIRTELEQKLTGYDFTSKYEKVVTKVQSKLSSKYIAVLTKIYELSTNMNIYKVISLTTAVGSLILIAIIKIKSLTIISAVSIFLLVVNYLLIPIISNKVLMRLKVQGMEIKMNPIIFYAAMILFISMFIVGKVFGSKSSSTRI